MGGKVEGGGKKVRVQSTRKELQRNVTGSITRRRIHGEPGILFFHDPLSSVCGINERIGKTLGDL